MLTVYTDGASSGNPGDAGIGVVIYENGKLIAKIGRYIGKTTNNIAEYTAVLEAVKYLSRKGIKEAEVRCDSQLLVRQMTGEYKIKDKNIKRIVSQVNNYRIKLKYIYIPRERNREADRIAKKYSKITKGLI